MYQRSLGESLTADARVSFACSDGSNSDFYNVKIDTGAYMTLLPQRAFGELKPEKFVRYSLFGVKTIPECAVECAIAPLRLRIMDSWGNISPELPIWAAISLGDDIPSLLGMKGGLDQYDHNWKVSAKLLEITF